MFKFKDLDLLTDGELDLKIVEKVPAIPEKKYLPTYKYDIYLHQSNTKVGFIDIRIGFNENIYYGGNIGYTVLEPFRGNHYALKACKIIKKVATCHHMKKLYITCNPDNLPSRKTCERLNLNLIGIVDLPSHNEMYQEGGRNKCIFEWVLKDE